LHECLVDAPCPLLLPVPTTSPWWPDHPLPDPTPWESALERSRREGTLLFNGPLLRLEEFETRGPLLLLHVGRTTYEAYVNTRAGPASWSPGAPRAHPLAVCAALETADGRLVLDRRRGVEGHAGRVHVVAGWIDPRRDTGSDPREAMAREIEEEVGCALPPGELACLGLVFDRVLPHPELCFHGRLGVPASALRPGSEMGGLYTVPFSPAGLEGLVEGAATTPTARGLLLLLGKRLWGGGRGNGAGRREGKT
jgi:8-oxo-dGTP pyrophosphatase MutT (NUDIX family)